MSVNILKMVSFKEVHDEIEKEADFLLEKIKINNHYDFSKKGDFLNKIGLGSSIASKLYQDIGNNPEIIERYRNNYPNNKFIFESQLERICEKYNLFVRNSNYFMGDIPVKNINDLMNFKFKINDVYDMLNNRFNEELLNNYDSYYSFNRFYNEFPNRKVPLVIAAIKELFNPEAFKKTNARISHLNELAPTAQVETDPIILLPVRLGYIIITAWGDEANDELVINQKLN